VTLKYLNQISFDIKHMISPLRMWRD